MVMRCALGKQSKFDEVNRQPGVSQAEIDERRSAAKTMGTINLVLTGAAVAGAVTTLVLYFTTPKRQLSSTAFVPWFDQRAAGASVLQRF